MSLYTKICLDSKKYRVLYKVVDGAIELISLEVEIPPFYGVMRQRRGLSRRVSLTGKTASKVVEAIRERV